MQMVYIYIPFALHLGENYLHITKSILLKTWHSVECCIALKVFLIMYVCHIRVCFLCIFLFLEWVVLFSSKLTFMLWEKPTKSIEWVDRCLWFCTRTYLLEIWFFNFKNAIFSTKLSAMVSINFTSTCSTQLMNHCQSCTYVNTK